MAYDKSKWARGTSHANSDIPTLWCYSTTDAESDIEGSGYFNSVADQVVVGDRILIHVDSDGSDTSEFTWVTANDGTTVTIQGLTALAAD